MKRLVIILSFVISLGLVGGALVINSYNNKVPTRAVSEAELKAANGKDGNECLVAVDGTIYRIEESAFWQHGEHTTSEGEAHCGADLSEAITHSPHGKTKLRQLEIIGWLEN